jgi:hypothetical protein
VSDGRWFYRSKEEFLAICEKLKLTRCPHCRVIGTLILHGFLRGYDEDDPWRQAVRARRIFCSNRKARDGCGRTFSVWLADKIRRSSLSAGRLWKFLKLVVASGMLRAIRALGSPLSDRTLQRTWKRFDLAQSKIRTALAQRCRAPDLASDQPAAQVIAHLEAAFPEASCPISAFQQTMRTFFS